ncbi:MAG: T9SS type A sorting domain-containing protein, partial [Chitinophagaceae bacterium]
VITSLFMQQSKAAIKRWNGSSSKDWSDVLNWTPGGLPLDSDEVVLDNLILAGNYSVFLPDGGVTIFSLEILPSSGRIIDLNIPASNIATPALNLIAPGNSILINAGGILKNSSGLSSGQSLLISGKLVLRNGALYIHNTRASHATGIIAKLSTDAGTEKGKFEFDVPGGAYAISLSNRNYGSLKLSAIASDGTQTYNATGTSITNIRGDLEIQKGVVFNLNLEKTLTIGGDFIQTGGVFNLANQPNNLQVIFKNSFIQDSSGVITETSTGVPEISFGGSGTQLISQRGVIRNSVAVNINNPYGVFLNADLTIPFSLHLRSGNIRTFLTAMVKVADNAIVTDASSLSFVDGPMMKTGDEDFEFPIGRQGDYAPLKLLATGRISTDKTIAEYHHGNPQQAFGAIIDASPILRISSLEYWTIEREPPVKPEKITLSVGAYSHATSLEKLVITQWDPDRFTWKYLGNTAFSGISSGTITSELADVRGVFTIGTTVADQNPLPVYFEKLKGDWLGDDLRIGWKAFNQHNTDQYRIDFSEDGRTFEREQTFDADSHNNDYCITKFLPGRSLMYARVTLLAGEGKEAQTQTILVKRSKLKWQLRVYPNPAHELTHVMVNADIEQSVNLQVFDLYGKMHLASSRQIKKGENDVAIKTTDLRNGTYLIRVTGKSGVIGTLKFIKF